MQFSAVFFSLIIVLQFSQVGNACQSKLTDTEEIYNIYLKEKQISPDLQELINKELKNDETFADKFWKRVGRKKYSYYDLLKESNLIHHKQVQYYLQCPDYFEIGYYEGGVYVIPSHLHLSEIEQIEENSPYGAKIRYDILVDELYSALGNGGHFSPKYMFNYLQESIEIYGRNNEELLKFKDESIEFVKSAMEYFVDHWGKVPKVPKDYIYEEKQEFLNHITKIENLFE